jgi:hypothetical protein
VSPADSAALTLSAHLGPQDWIVAVGASWKALYVYVTTKRRARGVPKEWEGYTVHVVNHGAVRPC